MINLNKRKYIDVPSNEEIKQEYEYLASIIKDVETVEQAVEFSKKYPSIEIEINYENIEDYLEAREKRETRDYEICTCGCPLANTEQCRTRGCENYRPVEEDDVEDEMGNKGEIEVIRYEYKHTMIYVYFENDKPQVKDEVFLYSDEGLEIGEAPYNDFDSTLEYMYNRGFLELNPDYSKQSE